MVSSFIVPYNELSESLPSIAANVEVTIIGKANRPADKKKSTNKHK